MKGAHPWRVQVLRRELLAALRRRGPCEHLFLSGPLHRNSWSFVYRGECAIYPKPVAVKLHWDPKRKAPDTKEARETILALEAVARIAHADPLCRCALPVDFIEDLGIVMTEWVEGTTLDRLLSRQPAAECQATVGMAGAWLARLHAATARGIRALETERILSAMEPPAQESSRDARGTAIRAAMAALRATAARASREPVAWVLAHGDFKPSNLFLSDGEIVGIDVQLKYEDAAVFDAAHFLNHLAFQLRWRTWAKGGADLALLERTFLAGYEKTSSVSLPRMQFLWVRLLNLLRLVIWYRLWSRWPSRVVTVMQLEGVMRGLTDELASASL